MSTQIVELTEGAWTQVYAGPTDTDISVERENRAATIFLAISESEPDFQSSGHYLEVCQVKGVSLDTGENLYAWCATGQLQGKTTNLIITD